MLGPDETVLQLAGLVLCDDNYPAGPIGKAFKHAPYCMIPVNTLLDDRVAIMVSSRDPNIDSPHQGAGPERVTEGNGGDEFASSTGTTCLLNSALSARKRVGSLCRKPPATRGGPFDVALLVPELPNPVADGGGDRRSPAVCTSRCGHRRGGSFVARPPPVGAGSVARSRGRRSAPPRRGT